MTEKKLRKKKRTSKQSQSQSQRQSVKININQSPNKRKKRQSTSRYYRGSGGPSSIITATPTSSKVDAVETKLDNLQTTMRTNFIALQNEPYQRTRALIANKEGQQGTLVQTETPLLQGLDPWYDDLETASIMRSTKSFGMDEIKSQRNEFTPISTPKTVRNMTRTQTPQSVKGFEYHKQFPSPIREAEQAINLTKRALDMGSITKDQTTDIFRLKKPSGRPMNLDKFDSGDHESINQSRYSQMFNEKFKTETLADRYQILNPDAKVLMANPDNFA